jgi:flagellin-like hook-associated protein FlgL
MASNITLSAGVRQNLLSLQKTADLMATTQNRLATGKKVNSALDNPTNFFTSTSLQARASDLSNLLDSMSNGIKTLEAADNGISAVTKTVESMQSTVRQARQDKSTSVTPGAMEDITNTSSATNNSISFDLGGGVFVSLDTWVSSNAVVSTATAVGGTYDADIDALTLTINDGTGADAITMATFDGTQDLDDIVDVINTDLGAANSTVRAANVGGELKLTNSTGAQITVAGTAAAGIMGTGSLTSSDGAVAVSRAKTLDEMITAINTSSALTGKVRASLDATNDLKLENLTTSAIAITGFDGTDFTGDATDEADLTAGTAATTSNVRQALSNQFSDLKTQLDKLAADASFNGINLLAGDHLKLNFNETGSSSIEVYGKNADGTEFGAISSESLGINGSYDFSDDADLDTLATALGGALTTLRTQASQYGTSLTSVQNRQEFTKAMINTLQTGADNLVLADSNEEAANMLALQTRQQLASTALSLASQADQQVLRLF